MTIEHVSPAGADQPGPRLVSRGLNLQVGFLGLDSLYLVIEYPHADLYHSWAHYVPHMHDPQLRQGIPLGDVLIRRGAHGYPFSLWDGDARLYITERVSEELRGTPQEGQGMGAMLQLGPQSLRCFGEIWEPKRLRESILAQLAAFGLFHPEQYPIRINRVDVTLDLIGLDLDTLPIDEWHDNWVGFSKPRALYYASTTGDVQGFTVGTSAGKTTFRIYNKSSKVRRKTSWTSGGQCGI